MTVSHPVDRCPSSAAGHFTTSAATDCVNHLEPRGYLLHRLLKFFSPPPFLRLVTASLMFVYLRRTRQTNRQAIPHLFLRRGCLLVRRHAPTVRLHRLPVCLPESLAPSSPREVRVRTECEKRGGGVVARALPYSSPPPPLSASTAVRSC